MRGNPRFGYSQKSGVTNLRESIELSQAMKMSKVRIEKKVICLIGSTKIEWKAKYREVLEKLTLMGNAVFTVVWFRGDFVGDFESRRELMEKVHFLKILSSDVIVIIDRNAVGDHTRLEMDYAKSLGKTIYYFDEIMPMCDLCGEEKETDPVQFEDALVRLCERCRIECEQTK